MTRAQRQDARRARRTAARPMTGTIKTPSKPAASNQRPRLSAGRFPVTITEGASA